MKSNIKDIYSLTPSQEGMYAQYFRHSDTKLYHLENLIGISKDTDIDILKKSVELLSVRHEVLKTAFTVLKSTGAVKQVILENRIPVFGVVTVNEPFSQIELDKIIAANTDKPFDLQKDSLFKVTVIDFSDARFMLFYAHHIILDGWCLAIIINDLQKYYSKLSAGISEKELINEINDEAGTQTSYAQYTKWIRSQDKKEIDAYWQSLLEDCTPAHIFGKEKKDNTENEDIFIFRTHLGEELSTRIDQFAKKNRVSPNTVFECAFGVALQKYSDSEDFVFDKVISGRSIPLKNIGNTVGPFINTVPVRIKSDENSTFADLLNETQKQTINANRYGLTALSDVYKTANIESRSIDALFVFENYFTGDTDEIKNGPLAPQFFPVDEYTEFNLNLTVLKENGSYVLRVAFARDVYSQEDINDFIKGYICILSSSDETQSIKDISVLSETEKHKILVEFNDTQVEYNKNTCIYKLFEEQVKINPEKTAVVYKDKRFTYSELYTITEEYAGKLVSLGIKADDTVAVHLERSHMLVVLQLAVLKIGGIFLPIDKRYPEDRINYACKDCNVKLFITDENISPETDVISINELENTESVSAETVINNNSCYIIYTSGSTGKPKGCLLTGKGLLNFCKNNNTLETLNKIENCTFACVNAVSFDYFIAESLLPLTNGFATVILDEEESTIQHKFMSVAEKNGINVLMTTPTRLKIFFNGKGNTDVLKQLKCICTSGEPLTEELLVQMYEKSPEAKVYNPIGPSECSVWDMGGELNREDGIDIHIGKPIANAQIYITDKYLNPVPIGVTGEICIAGDGVGNGYVNNPELTEEKFVENPFGKGKLYKTGDLGYWRADGNIVFIGRNDFQVKIRGLRIELGEIENAVSEVDGINLAVAVVRTDEQGRQHICVFYTGEEKTSNEIKEQISQKLPKYMVPHIFIHLDDMPMTSSGKINRKALPEEVVFAFSTETEPPVNETEKFVCKAFSRILGTDEIGRNSDFFEMGGTSLSMITLLSDKAFDDIRAAEFIENSTPAALSALMTDSKGINNGYLEPLYVSDKSGKALILTPYGGGGAESFTGFVKEFRKIHKDVSLYFVSFLHSDEDCEKAALEIENSLSDCKVTFYSHCAGSAVALKILEKLEKDDFIVENYFAGAFIPSEIRSKKNNWKNAPDFVIRHLLDKSGAKFGEISKETQKRILMRFRKDTDYLTRVLYDFSVKIKTPVTVIVSTEDYFTKNYDDAEKCWSHYAENVTQVKFIDSSSHYFQSDDADKLVKFIRL